MNIVIKTLIPLLLVGCNNPLIPDYWEFNIPETSGKEVFDGDPEPLRPPFWKGQKGLHGIDSDNDGVRDDVEIFINRNQEDSILRILYKDYYKANLKTVSTINSEKSYLNARDSFGYKYDCILNYNIIVKKNNNRNSNKKFYKKLDSLIQNTWERDRAYVAAALKDKRIFHSVSSGTNKIKILRKYCKYPEEVLSIIVDHIKKGEW